jgi:hypothetical protein
MKDRFVEAGVPAEKITVLRHCWKSDDDDDVAPEGEHYLFIGRLVAETTPFSPPSSLAQRLFQESPAKSKFLAINN